MQLWLDRKFDFGHLGGNYLPILERLEGTPFRLAHKMEGLHREALVKSTNGKWSIAEHAGHLLTMESLWMARMDDMALGRPTLRPWNGTNQDTQQAQFHLQNPASILRDFTTTRLAMVSLLRTWTGKEETMSAFHPRLQVNVRLIDHAWFVAEHDDHHLALIQTIVESHLS